MIMVLQLELGKQGKSRRKFDEICELLFVIHLYCGSAPELNISDFRQRTTTASSSTGSVTWSSRNITLAKAVILAVAKSNIVSGAEVSELKNPPRTIL